MSGRISYNTPNPESSFSWGKTCPKCGSEEISMRENPKEPMWKCRGCGNRFDSINSDTLRTNENE